MKIPLKWLADYVKPTLPVAELVERLTLAGLEVSGVRLIGVPPPEGLRVKAEEAGPVWPPDKIVIAEITRVVPHPDPEVVNLKLPTVTYGQGRTKDLVTGAPNVKVGDAGVKVILALTGSQLYNHHAKTNEKKLQELKPAKIRGIPSDAMVCSAFELGLSDDREGGIILLEDEAPVGTPLVEYMGDVVLEIDVLPNMARCLALIGVAREVAALTAQQVTLPPHEPPAKGKPIEGRVRVQIEDPRRCARYAAMLLEGVRIGPSPGWVQRRLSYAGMRPINNVVDVTNYVLLEWGQPLHAFDYDKLLERAGGGAPTIIVRMAREGEVLATLDEGNRAAPLALTPDMLVIADEKGPIALAGIKGGADTMVTEATRNILLESANFDFLTIRRTMRLLELPSEASVRFSKGIHPGLVRPAAGRAALLMHQLAGAAVAQGVVDVYPMPLPPQVVDLRMSEVRRILGVDLPVEECTRILRALEFKVEKLDADTLRATVPPHRLDIQEGAADLIEELVRLHGYDRLPAALLADRLPPQTGNEALAFEERVRDRLVAAGLQEVISYSLTTPEREAPLGPPPSEYVTLRNPISSERVVMRHTVLAGVLEAAARNLKEQAGDVRLFEIGAVYLPRSGANLPDEPRRLAVVLCGRRHPEWWGAGGREDPPLDFYDLKGVIETLAADLHLADVSYRPAKVAALHPGRSAEVVVGGKAVGYLGELHPRAAAAFEKMEGRQVLAAELDLDALRAAVPERHLYAPVPQFPAALRDVAVVVAEDVPAGRVEAEIRAGGGELLQGLRLFDVYRGEAIPAGHKSLAYALTYRAADRTLTDREVEQAHKKIENRLRHVLKADIRAPK